MGRNRKAKIQSTVPHWGNLTAAIAAVEAAKQQVMKSAMMQALAAGKQVIVQTSTGPCTVANEDGNSVYTPISKTH